VPPPEARRSGVGVGRAARRRWGWARRGRRGRMPPPKLDQGEAGRCATAVREEAAARDEACGSARDRRTGRGRRAGRGRRRGVRPPHGMKPPRGDEADDAVRGRRPDEADDAAVGRLHNTGGDWKRKSG